MQKTGVESGVSALSVLHLNSINCLPFLFAYSTLSGNLTTAIYFKGNSDPQFVVSTFYHFVSQCLNKHACRLLGNYTRGCMFLGNEVYKLEVLFLTFLVHCQLLQKPINNLLQCIGHTHKLFASTGRKQQFLIFVM